MSIVGTFSVMYLVGFSLDNISLMALTLVRRASSWTTPSSCWRTSTATWKWASRPMQATLDGAKEVGFTIVSMTLSLAAVFIPVLFMGGILGRLLHEFAVTIMAAVLVSGFVSLTLTPMLCSRWLRPEHEENARPGLSMERTRLRRHARSLRSHAQMGVAASPHDHAGLRRDIRRHRRGCSHIMPKGFLPSADTGQLLAFTEAAQDISFEAMAQKQRQAANIVRADPNVESVMAFIGPSSTPARSQTLNLGRILVKLKDRDQRLHADAIIQELRPKLSVIPGLKVYLQNIPPIRIGGKAHQERIPVHAAGRGHRGAVSLGADPGGEGARPAGLPWTSTATCRSPIRPSRSRSTATRLPRSASPPSRSRTRSTAPSARARFPPSTRRATSTG